MLDKQDADYSKLLDAVVLALLSPTSRRRSADIHISLVRQAEVRVDYRSLDRSLQRLRKAGKIRCDRGAGPAGGWIIRGPASL